MSGGLDPIELKEKYYQSLDVIKELKKQNNKLQDAVKKLKTRTRWPDNIKVAVLGKEATENQKMVEHSLLELSNRCSMYEKEIEALRRAQSHNQKTSTPIAAAGQVSSQEGPYKIQLSKAEARASMLQSSLDRTMQDWREKESAYKQQLEEASSRLQQTEERLAQVLRLRTLDSAELVRLSRANKIKAAEVTTMQDENHRLKLAADDARTRMAELVEQLNHEQKRKTDLQEEVAQSQLNQQTMHDLAQELEEAKKECEMLRGHLKSTLADVGQDNEKMSDPIINDDEVSSLQLKIELLERALNEEKAAHQWVSLQLEELKNEKAGQAQKFMAENKRLREMLEKRTSPVSPHTEDCNTTEKYVQTMNMELDFKPPELTSGLTAEEGDQALAQMHLEIESHRELVRTQTHLAKLFQDELESLQEQLRGERARYAEELAQKVARIEEMQVMLQCHSSETRKPTPAPRRSIPNNEDISTLQGLEIDIESLSATENSPLLDDGHGVRLFIDYMLSSSQDSSQETPGNFARPTESGVPVPINHSEQWHSQELNKNSSVQFNVVGDPQVETDEEPNDLDEDCIDFGSGELQLKEIWDVLVRSGQELHMDVPLLSEDKDVIGYLKITARQPTIKCSDSPY